MRFITLVLATSLLTGAVRAEDSLLQRVGLKPRRVTPGAEELVTVRTAIGQVSLPRETVAAEFADSRARSACLVTEYGDVFIIVRRARFALSRRERRTDDGRPAPEYRRAPPLYAAWRLTSGDIFYARFAEESLVARWDSRKAAPVEVPTAGIESLVRTPDGRLMCGLGGADTPIWPDRKYVRATLACTGRTVRIPIGAIEHMRRCLIADMPPAVRVRPGAIPVVEGVVQTKGGAFTMGRTRGDGPISETPAATVKLSSFAIDACEVTVSQFARFVTETRYRTSAERAHAPLTWRNPGFSQRIDSPVVCVSWYDAARYCNWRSKRAGLRPCYGFPLRGRQVRWLDNRNGYRLPTEAEWEFAARGEGRDLLYAWGDDPEGATEFAVFRHSEAQSVPSAVKAFPQNAIGLYAMSGNVWEWCEDVYHEQAYRLFHGQDCRDPQVTLGSHADAPRRVMRGGSFDNDLAALRCVARGFGLPEASAPRIGFRCARNAAKPAARKWFRR